MISYGGRPVVGFGVGDVPCPSNPSVPDGYLIWKGAVPPELTQWVIALRDQLRSYPYGQRWTTDWNGFTVLARKDHHTWTYRPQPNGAPKLVTGLCLPGITLYRPEPQLLAGLGIAAVDPATALPDPDLALYLAPTASPPPIERTDWPLTAACAAAIVVVTGAVVWGIQAAAARPT
jgi:hypothetical protein